jgi:uncharacterized phage protein (TIGR02216 family)
MDRKKARLAHAPFPWGEAMAFGFGVLRHTPRAFWAMTPRELAAAADGAFGKASGAPSRNDLRALIAAFPDGRL